ncbi:TonB family protein [Sphingopyxis indica]|uniref:TonB family C-terminal domain-containing protein n=1 Tax=Sphingopyxis indica TaxID=436663 RepID=A0A239J343_9SPHN|nr:TonB family protein [Sphingopyxis indica]WOF42064.1 energy transducer TonB [Sphingopyxis indica]SNT00331.1 TonB family C-terminal domain-containing protein [Sphingopyxis indica]
MLTMMLLLAMQGAPARGDETETGPAPATNPGSWVTSYDYPASAMREEREGTAGFRLTIGTDGLPTRCEITAPSGHADLDAETCRLIMERARFTPGRNARGEAVGGTYSNRIRWQIPEGSDHAVEVAGFGLDTVQESWPRGAIPDDAFTRIDPAAHYPPAALAAREQGTVHMELAVDSAGRVSACKVNESSLSAALDDAACALMHSEGKFSPALDSDGKPTKGVLAAKFRWALPDQVREGGEGVSVAPDPDFPMGEPGSATMTVLVGADGRVQDCRFSNTGKFGAAPNGMTPCDMFGRQTRYTPFTDADGRPVAKRVILRSDLTIEDAPAAIQ